MTLSQLRELAQAHYPNTHLSMAHYLAAWAKADADFELQSLLHETGLNVASWAKAIEPLLLVSLSEERDFFIACVAEVSDGVVTGRHLLTCLIGNPEQRISRCLQAAGLNLSHLKIRLEETKQPQTLFARAGIKINTKANPLLQYGRDLTALAREGAFDELCDRPEELNRLLGVLLRKQKGNGILTGPAGVGKTALVELLARNLAHNTVPAPLTGSRLFEVSLGKIVAGTRYRGDFEERMEQIIQAMQASQPAILFMDEIHLLWSAGRAEDIITDGANLLKPVLARSAFKVIGATTVDEYHQYLTKDQALTRRFQEVRIAEPDEAMTLKMIKKQSEGLEKHHAVAISEAVLSQAFTLSNRHLPNRWQPDKSIDLLDSTAVMLVREGRKVMTPTDLLYVLSEQTGYPIATLTGEDKTTLRNLSASLKSRIIGQDQAVHQVTSTLIERRQDIGFSERNLGTFLFAGETGVGKTELARAIAETFFCNKKALLHLDLAEYSSPETINKLIGSPVGFRGSDKDAILIQWLHTYGSGVILFDEVEKGHVDIQHLLLGMLDNGRIHSAGGEVMDTRQCVVILTTNALKPRDLNRSGVGFQRSNVPLDPTDLLLSHFPQEFLGRLDKTILFNALGQKEMRAILKLRLNEAVTRLEKKKITLVFEEKRLLDHLLSNLIDQKSGARGIARLLESRLLQPLSMAMLYHDGAGMIKAVLEEPFYRDGTVEIKGNEGDEG